VISIIDKQTITTDLGYKSVAAESPLPRIYFLNAVDSLPISQSEEHLVVKVADSAIYSIGDLLYGVPFHICPTVALYNTALLIKKKKVATINFICSFIIPLAFYGSSSLSTTDDLDTHKRW
jgi:D-serine deaminase-like pyridoxal phosphate-dependent protein